MFAFLLVMRYMVATGMGSTDFDYSQRPNKFLYPKPQIVDVSNPTKSCELNDDVTDRFSTGGMLGTTPVICGGSGVMSHECLLYGTSQMITMNSDRKFSSSVGLSNSMLWIMGGELRNHMNLDTTEFVTIEGSVNGPQLPEPVSAHCSVHFPGNGNVYVIGGINPPSNNSTNKVWVANPSNKFTFAQGPSLNKERSSHACSTMSIGTKNIIVAAGGSKQAQPKIFEKISSVEILDPLSDQWVAGN